MMLKRSIDECEITTTKEQQSIENIDNNEPARASSSSISDEISEPAIKLIKIDINNDTNALSCLDKCIQVDSSIDDDDDNSDEIIQTIIESNLDQIELNLQNENYYNNANNGINFNQDNDEIDENLNCNPEEDLQKLAQNEQLEEYSKNLDDEIDDNDVTITENVDFENDNTILSNQQSAITSISGIDVVDSDDHQHKFDDLTPTTEKFTTDNDNDASTEIEFNEVDDETTNSSSSSSTSSGVLSIGNSLEDTNTSTSSVGCCGGSSDSGGETSTKCQPLRGLLKVSTEVERRTKSPKLKKKVIFNNVTVFYFKRSQGFTCVPSQGGSTLGMENTHSYLKRFTLESHAEERKRAHREILSRRKRNNCFDHQKSNKQQQSSPSESEDDSYDDEFSDLSDVDLENDTCYFLQPVPIKQRRALLRASGVRKIETTEKEECRDIRISREFCGCDCRVYCNPDHCSCYLAGIKCQVDRMSFPCGCTRDGCGNLNGRIEFNPMRVQTHFIHTIMRLEMEKKKSSIPFQIDHHQKENATSYLPSASSSNNLILANCDQNLSSQSSTECNQILQSQQHSNNSNLYMPPTMQQQNVHYISDPVSSGHHQHHMIMNVDNSNNNSFINSNIEYQETQLFQNNYQNNDSAEIDNSSSYSENSDYSTTTNNDDEDDDSNGDDEVDDEPTITDDNDEPAQHHLVYSSQHQQSNYIHHQQPLLPPEMLHNPISSSSNTQATTAVLPPFPSINCDHLPTTTVSSVVNNIDCHQTYQATGPNHIDSSYSEAFSSSSSTGDNSSHQQQPLTSSTLTATPVTLYLFDMANHNGHHNHQYDQNYDQFQHHHHHHHQTTFAANNNVNCQQDNNSQQYLDLSSSIPSSSSSSSAESIILSAAAVAAANDNNVENVIMPVVTFTNIPLINPSISSSFSISNDYNNHDNMVKLAYCPTNDIMKAETINITNPSVSQIETTSIDNNDCGDQAQQQQQHRSSDNFGEIIKKSIVESVTA